MGFCIGQPSEYSAVSPEGICTQATSSKKKGLNLRGSKVEDIRNTGDMEGTKGKGK